jgi:hypothetical protein
MTNLQKVARRCTLMLLEVGDKKKQWKPEESAAWTRAFNALQRLSGHKIRKKK